MSRPMKKRPKEKYLVITIGSGRNRVTATFFNVKQWFVEQLAKGTRIMLSGEVSYFRAPCSLRIPIS
ncbi:OB-fold nucleic acid binding domain protein [Mycobacterium xenopi 4042]|uniref:OB-fold nucleic acid binding domain protein n=1 Tax=Mycobacterium xenopi 4042 TaxID=1299334 RepID=X8E8W2_MYCXE|nr:OB-fold nucleic acid binding domain protein [Mycobacterium xenopi 4042]